MGNCLLTSWNATAVVKSTCYNQRSGQLSWEQKSNALLQVHLFYCLFGFHVSFFIAAIPEAKKQLVVRFHVIKYVLAHVYEIKPELIIFIGRVFYRRTPEGSKALESEDGSGNDLEVLSFYYHKM
jgi:hypothetical protein